jgi:hypothetical protein
MIPTTNKHLLLEVHQYAVEFMVNEGFAAGGIQAYEQFLLESAMRAIRISFKCPVQVLKRDEEIARYPATLWSHLLHTLRLRRWARYKVVRLNEHLAFPGIEIPPELKLGAYITYSPRITLEAVKL